MMISQTDRDRELYESRLKMRRDMNAALADATEAGRLEGRAKGREEGRVEVQVRRIQSLQRLLRQEVNTPEQLRFVRIRTWKISRFSLKIS